jgi:hypothetical protein
LNDDGSILTGRHLKCAGDHALDAAVAIQANFRAMEVWCGDRFVKRYPATDPATRRCS